MGVSFKRSRAEAKDQPRSASQDKSVKPPRARNDVGAAALRGMRAVAAGEVSARLGLLSKQGLDFSGEAGRKLYACCKPDVRLALSTLEYLPMPQSVMGTCPAVQEAQVTVAAQCRAVCLRVLSSAHIKYL